MYLSLYSDLKNKLRIPNRRYNANYSGMIATTSAKLKGCMNLHLIKVVNLLVRQSGK